MAHVFISYSHSDIDRAYARKLADYLIAEHFDVWIDDRINFGSRWMREIQTAIDNCKAFIVIMSPQSFDSEWVENERIRAKARNKIVFPLLLEGEPFFDLGGTQYYDVRGEKLPEAKFLEQLAVFTKRTETKGRDVAAIPQEIASHSYETSDTKRLARAIAVLAIAVIFVGGGGIIYILTNGRNLGGFVNTPTTTATQTVENTLIAVLPTTTFISTPTATSLSTTTHMFTQEPTPSLTHPAANNTSLQRGVDVLAYCDDRSLGAPPPDNLAVSSTIDIFWNWFGKTREQVQDHIDAADYIVRLDNQEVDYETHQQNIHQENGLYVVYWFVPSQPLNAGWHYISYQVTWSHRITDGFQSFGPGTNNPEQTGSCTFWVNE